MKNRSERQIDPILYIIVIVLVVFGIMMIFSASYYDTIYTEDEAGHSDGPFYYLIRASLLAGGGVILMLIATFFPYRVYEKVAVAAMIVSIILLIAVLIPGIGYTVNGATRWIKIGPITIMPVEIAKVSVVMFVAWYYTKYAKYAKSLVRGFLAMFILIGILFLLIYQQPNLSSALIIIITIIATMYIAGVRLGYILALIPAGIIGLLFLIMSKGGEHLNRITGFTDPFSDAQGEFFQTVQSLIALGSGGLTGVGIGNSVQKAFWLPFAQTDFIFAVIGEEVGFIGCILVLIAYLVLIWRCALIAITAADRYSMLLAAGITMLLTLQVVLNIGVVTALLPPTGVILPFISYGGNATIWFMFLMGVMQNIARGGAGIDLKRRRKSLRHEGTSNAEVVS